MHVLTVLFYSDMCANISWIDGRFYFFKNICPFIWKNVCFSNCLLKIFIFLLVIFWMGSIHTQGLTPTIKNTAWQVFNVSESLAPDMNYRHSCISLGLYCLFIKIMRMIYPLSTECIWYLVILPYLEGRLPQSKWKN